MIDLARRPGSPGGRVIVHITDQPTVPGDPTERLDGAFGMLIAIRMVVHRGTTHGADGRVGVARQMPLQPIQRGDRVIVDQEDDLSGRPIQRRVLGRHDARLGQMNDLDRQWQLHGHPVGEVARWGVVALPDDDHLARGNGLPRQARRHASSDGGRRKLGTKTLVFIVSFHYLMKLTRLGEVVVMAARVVRARFSTVADLIRKLFKSGLRPW